MLFFIYDFLKNNNSNINKKTYKRILKIIKSYAFFNDLFLNIVLNYDLKTVSFIFFNEYNKTVYYNIALNVNNTIIIDNLYNTLLSNAFKNNIKINMPYNISIFKTF